MTTYTGTSVAGTSGINGVSSISTQAGYFYSSYSGTNALYAQSDGGNGIQAYANGTSYTAVNASCSASGGGWGVIGAGYVGLLGQANQSSGHGVAVTDSGYSNCVGLYVLVTGTGSTAATIGGDVYINGTLTKTGGSFLIDHPLDPANKVLEHSFVESPDRKNIYDGVGVADENGELIIQLPGYFEALNEEFRYQLTALGGPAPNLHVRTEIANGQFTIAGANSRQRVSWQVTGSRCDAWAKLHPIDVEREKPAHEKGVFHQPAVFGKPLSDGIVARRGKIATTNPPNNAP